MSKRNTAESSEPVTLPSGKEDYVSDYTIAQIAHEVNRAYQIALGDPNPSPAWDDAPDDQRESALKGIATALGGATAEQQHEAWMAYKVEQGWTLGSVKSADLKTHPSLKPYADLPAAERAKDAIYQTIVRQLAALRG